MTLRRQIYVSLLIAVLLCGAVALADPIDKIKPTGYVTDLAGVISADSKQKLEALCTEVEQKTGAQIAAVTVKSLDGESVENYAVDLYKHLGVGHKDNRGVLVLIAPNDRRYRVEVGYGLEPVINDARAGDIGRAMVPYLKQNDFSSAMVLGVTRSASFIAADKNVKLDSAPAGYHRVKVQQPSTGFPWWLPFLLFGGFTGFIGLISKFTGHASTKRRRDGSSFWWLGPGGFGGGGWGGGGFGGGSSGGDWGGSSGGFGGFGGGESGGGGASGSW